MENIYKTVMHLRSGTLRFLYALFAPISNYQLVQKKQL